VGRAGRAAGQRIGAWLAAGLLSGPLGRGDLGPGRAIGAHVSGVCLGEAQVGDARVSGIHVRGTGVGGPRGSGTGASGTGVGGTRVSGADVGGRALGNNRLVRVLRHLVVGVRALLVRQEEIAR
jgi:hypothetical protein